MANRKQFLIMAAAASLVITLAAGYYYWDAIALAAMATLVWTKKLITWKGLWLLVKKTPFLLMLGLKRLLIRITTGFLLFTAHMRFRPVRRALIYFRRRARQVRHRLLRHWQAFTPIEQLLVLFTALPLALVLTTLLVLLFLPKTVVTLLSNKLKEHSSAAMLKKAARMGAEDQLALAEQKIRTKIKTLVANRKQQPKRLSDLEDRGEGTGKQE